MGQSTGEVIRTIRTTGRGSEHYGACDQCGRQCSEHFVSQGRRVYMREDGLRYLAAVSGGAYGHRECLIESFGPAIDESSLKRIGSLLQAPEAS